MPNHSSVTFAVQPVQQQGKISGYVISGFLSKNQPETLRVFVDNENHERSKRWRGE